MGSRRLPAGRGRNDQSRDEAVVSALGIIHREFPERVLLPAVAAEVGIDRYAMSRRFKQATGVTFRDYVMTCRVEKACELLRGATNSITEIAQDVGFGDLPRLDKVFRRRLGMSPREYRRRNRPHKTTSQRHSPRG